MKKTRMRRTAAWKKRYSKWAAERVKSNYLPGFYTEDALKVRDICKRRKISLCRWLGEAAALKLRPEQEQTNNNPRIAAL